MIAAPYARVAELAEAFGAEGINRLPGCWEHAIDDAWWVAVNGHGTERTCSRGVTVPPYAVAIMYGCAPAGVVTPAGGWIAAGEGANEATFLAAVEQAIRAAGAQPEGM